MSTPSAKLIFTNKDYFAGCLLTRLDLPTDKLAQLAGGTNPDAYRDEENGYDGWSVTGTYDGETFDIYTRWGMPRIGGEPDRLDVWALVADLTAAVNAL